MLDLRFLIGRDRGRVRVLVRVEEPLDSRCAPVLNMKLNEKNVASFAVCSSPIDKEGYLLKKGDVGKSVQRRWFVLKGNLLFYFEKKQDKEPLGVVVLEACSVQASAQTKYAFEISFDGQGTRTYVMVADNDEDMQSWLKAISHASYEYLRSIVDELQRRVNVLTSSSKIDGEQVSDMSLLHVGPPKGAEMPEMKRGSAASTPAKVRVQNGILVDIDDDEAPPIPPKLKSHAVHGSKRQLPKVSIDNDDDYDIPPSHTEDSDEDIQAKPRTMHQLRPLPPHSSPMVIPACINTVQPLSPPSTLDRTAVLQPVNASTLPASPGSKEIHDPPSSQTLVDSASSHPLVTRQLAAPPDPKKTIFEMHEEFTQAMQQLRSERTTSNSTT